MSDFGEIPRVLYPQNPSIPQANPSRTSTNPLDSHFTPGPEDPGVVTARRLPEVTKQPPCDGSRSEPARRRGRGTALGTTSRRMKLAWSIVPFVCRGTGTRGPLVRRVRRLTHVVGTLGGLFRVTTDLVRYKPYLVLVSGMM